MQATSCNTFWTLCIDWEAVDPSSATKNTMCASTLLGSVDEQKAVEDCSESNVKSCLRSHGVRFETEWQLRLMKTKHLDSAAWQPSCVDAQERQLFYETCSRVVSSFANAHSNRQRATGLSGRDLRNGTTVQYTKIRKFESTKILWFFLSSN